MGSNSDRNTGARGLAPIQELQLTPEPKTVEQYWRNGLLSREVGHEDREGLDAFFRERNEAIKQGKLDVLMAQEDYPLFVVTDTTTGESVADIWDAKKNGEVMGQAIPYGPKGELLHEDRQYLFITNDMAISYETNAFIIDGKKVTWKAANLLVKRGGKWKNKAILEGGFGDFLLSKGFVK
jgi:hypothetical protein